PGGVGAHGTARARVRGDDAALRAATGVPPDAVLQDRAQPAQARPPRRLAPRALRRARRVAPREPARRRDRVPLERDERDGDGDRDRMRVVRAQAALGSPWGPFTAGELMGVPDGEGERILDVAMECFVGFGVRQTSVELIARRAGLSRPTVYKRFPGRDGVARALFVREARRFLSAVADTARA